MSLLCKYFVIAQDSFKAINIYFTTTQQRITLICDKFVIYWNVMFVEQVEKHYDRFINYVYVHYFLNK